MEEKQHSSVISSKDKRDYIAFQFQGLITTLDAFEYNHMARILRALFRLYQRMPEDSIMCLNPSACPLRKNKPSQ